MLRALFDEPKRRDEGLYRNTVQALRTYEKRLQKWADENPKDCRLYTKLQLWTKGFETGLNELEQSVYCAVRFRERVAKPHTEAMTEEELTDYQRHVYFFKNAFIRMFSILDKLGYFLNELYGLQTEKVKSRFSYYTVLRRFPERKVEPELHRRLTEWKVKYQPAMARLRKKRNMEIHLMNVEMLDDLERSHMCAMDRTYVENLSENMNDLRLGFEMVCHSLLTSFEWIERRGAGRRS